MRASLLFVLVALPALAQEAASPPVAGAPATLPLRVGDAGVILLKSGSTVTGTIQVADAEKVVVVFADDLAFHLPAANVLGRLGPLPGQPGQGGLPPGDVRVVTASGVRHGALLARTAELVRLRSPDGATFEIPLAEIRQLGFVGDEAARARQELDPARFRHLFVPSAEGPRRLECAVTVSGFVPLDVACGLTSWLSASAAVALPVVFGDGLPPVAAAAGLTLRTPRLAGFRAAAGVNVLASRWNTLGFLHGELTFATRASSSTVYLGPAPRMASRLAELDAVVAGVGHTQRLTRRFTAVVEAWASRGGTGLDAVGAAALRLHQGALAFDLGAVGGPRTVVPWIAFTYDGAGETP